MRPVAGTEPPSEIARAIAKRDTSQMRADTDHHQIGVMARNGAVLILRCGLAGKIGIARIGVWQRRDRLFTRLSHLRLRPVADKTGFPRQLTVSCVPSASPEISTEIVARARTSAEGFI